MIGPAPSITNSKFFVAKPVWHMKDDAPDRMKALFEKQMNSEDNRYIWMLDKYKNMQNPFLRWNGEVIDRK